jgi:hypothetical protein
VEGLGAAVGMQLSAVNFLPMAFLCKNETLKFNPNKMRRSLLTPKNPAALGQTSTNKRLL